MHLQMWLYVGCQNKPGFRNPDDLICDEWALVKNVYPVMMNNVHVTTKKVKTTSQTQPKLLQTNTEHKILQTQDFCILYAQR